MISPDQFAKLPEDERERIAATVVNLQGQLKNTRANPAMVEGAQRARHSAQSRDHADDFRKQEESTTRSGLSIVTRESFHRYQVNVLVIHGKQTGAPIVSDDNPTYSNLIGRVEHISQLGALVTDFTLITPGALHRANGGYPLLDARKALTQPFAWESLKRALQSREIRIESLGQMYSLVSTVSLWPELIARDVKIVRFGDRLFCYLLRRYDPDFSELFKVAADFEDRIERGADTHLRYARLVAILCAKEKLLPFDRGAVARVAESLLRLADEVDRRLEAGG